MQDVMVDLETLGTRAGCAILSIGAVAFDENSEVLGEKFYTVVNTADCLCDGKLFVEQPTKDWWENQSKEAQTVLRMAKSLDTSDTLIDSLTLFNAFLRKSDPDVRVWGNGADFDTAILYAAYAAVGLRPAWKYYNSRCHRTLCALVPTAKRTNTGIHHNALDDATAQAHQAVACLRVLHGTEPQYSSRDAKQERFDFGD